ncbi:MAG TPA: very short patch repair endonuclease [Pirellulales bacterium]|nr:very short patch repair endonuclease [Pirellulales bacterium]
MDTLTVAERSRRMSLVRAKDTKPELVVRRLVHSLGYRYRLHISSLPGCPDLVFPSRRKVILVHGCFWHQHSCKLGDRMPKSRLKFWRPKLERNRLRDTETMRSLRHLGWRVLIVWECQIFGKPRARLVKRICAFLERDANKKAQRPAKRRRNKSN